MKMAAHLKDHPWFLQQICSHVGTNDTVTCVKSNLNVFPKTTAVVVPGGLCVSNGLTDKKKTKKKKLKTVLNDIYLHQLHQTGTWIRTWRHFNIWSYSEENRPTWWLWAEKACDWLILYNGYLMTFKSNCCLYNCGISKVKLKYLYNHIR